MIFNEGDRILMKMTDFRVEVLYPIYKVAMGLAGRPLHLPLNYTGQGASDAIKELLAADKPCMICRFGSLELSVVVAYLNLMDLNFIQRIWRFTYGESISWDATLRYKICYNAGFFPPEAKQLCRFAELMLENVAQIDLLGSWHPGELRIRDHLPTNAKAVPITDLEPYYHPYPWSQILSGKKVLVVHPFTETIKRQYAKRELLFSNPDVLPEFELKTLTAIQSSAGSKVEFPTWFDALKHMYDEMDRIEFDVAIIGAGAYGFPLAAHAKHTGRKAVHLGGSLQLLFGIRGRRWDRKAFYQKLYNEHWTRPASEETPIGYQRVEGGTYW